MAEWEGVGEEWRFWGNRLPYLGGLPTTVITAKGPPNADALEWTMGQDRLRGIAKDVEFINASCHHMVHLAKPKLVCDKIREMYDRVRPLDNNQPQASPLQTNIGERFDANERRSRAN